MITQKIIRDQQAGRMCFGGVALDIKHMPESDGLSKLLFSFDDLAQADSLYHEVIRTGTAWFFSYYVLAHPGDLSVKVVSINWLPGDTTAAVLQYATVLALTEALDFTISGIVFDCERAELLLPVAEK